MRRGFRTICIVTAAATMLAAAGCAGKDENQASTGSLGDTYPMSGNATVTYWMQLNSALLTTETEMTNTPFAKGLQEATGINIQYIHPSPGQVDESFNIMLASGSLPDIIEWNWYRLPGGPQKAIDNGYIISLNDVMDKYAPNLKKYLSNNPEIDKMVKTDKKDYYVFPFLRGDDLLLTYSGPAVRKDWLEDLQLPVPETIDDWTAMLRAFKAQKNAEAALTYEMESLNSSAPNSSECFIGAYGIKGGFYAENGEVKFGPVQPAYKDYLALMNLWYSEGLLDTNIADITSKILDTNMLSGRSGAMVMSGGRMGKYLSAKPEKDPKFDLLGVKYPVLHKGERAMFGQSDFNYALGSSAAISTGCKNVEAAARLLDYGYSEEGMMYYNFGKEGETYNMKDGYPTYTDEIVNNPDGLAMTNALARYVRAGYAGPFVQKKEYIEQYYSTEQQRSALNQWRDNDATKYVLPLVTYNPEDSAKMANVMNEINTYVDEYRLKFIMGVETLDNFDKFVNQIYQLGLEDVLAIQKKAVDNYNNR